MQQRRIRTEYTIRSPLIREELNLAVAPDLHSGPFEDVLEELFSCDAVLIPGDLVDRHRRDNTQARRFLEEVPKRVPVFYSLGNHETKFRESSDYLDWVRKETRATLLENRWTAFRGILLGGLSSISGTGKNVPDLRFLEDFEKEHAFKVLLCHHPEMYRDYVRGRGIDLTLCGHAHGGQIQILGHGLYAPGQGLLPKLTHGVHDGGRMILSRGMTNAAKPRFPRIGNPCELIVLHLTGETDNTEKEKNNP